MYYRNNYDYIGDVAGYYNNPYIYDTRNLNMEQDLESMYPEIYRVVHPMVIDAVSNMSGPVTEDMLARLTDDIYDRVRADGRINMEIDDENRQFPIDPFHHGRPHRRNRFARDLIRILLIRELLSR